MDYSQKAVELDSMGVDGHLRWAIVAGRLALFRGGKELIRLSKQVREQSMKVALRLRISRSGGLSGTALFRITTRPWTI